MSANGETPDGLSVRLHRRIHANLGLDVELELKKEVGVVFGASGAGKTTLLRLIAGLEHPDSGRVQLEDRILFDSTGRINLPLRRRAIGMIFQHDLLFPHLLVRENIGFGLRGWAGARMAERIDEVARLCGVEPLLGRRPETLSGGERQRVGLARSLAPRPRLLLCDEPVSALDLASRNALIDRLKAIQRAEEIPILYVTHSPDEAISLGDTLFLLDRGRIVEQGPPIEILSRFRQQASHRREEARNTFPAVVKGPLADNEATYLEIQGGPTLQVPFLDLPSGSEVRVEIRSSDIMVAAGPTTLSIRNVLAGEVEQIVVQGSDAELTVRTGGVEWIVGVAASAVSRLELAPGGQVFLIVQARSCLVRQG